MKHEVVKIVNRKGEILYGVLSVPEKNMKNIFILFCQAGLVYKTGVGNQFKILCDYLAKNGYYVLRFDQSGTGDSQGCYANDIPVKQFFSGVMQGAFTNDTQDVLEWVINNYSNYKIILMGQCGGALSMIYAGKDNKNVSGFIAITIPVLLLPEDGEKQTVHEFESNIIMYSYLKNLFVPRKYINLFKGKTDFNLLISSFLTFSNKIIRRFTKFLKKGGHGKPDHPRFNWMFWDAFKAIMQNKKPIFFIMADLDNEAFDFSSEFKSKVLDKESSFSKFVIIDTIKGADHSMMFNNARNKINHLIKDWINNLFYQGDRSV